MPHIVQIRCISRALTSRLLIPFNQSELELVNDHALRKYTDPHVSLMFGIQQAPGSASPKDGYYWGSGDNVSDLLWCDNESGDAHGENENPLFLRVNTNQYCFLDSDRNYSTYFVCEQGNFKCSFEQFVEK